MSLQLTRERARTSDGWIVQVLTGDTNIPCLTRMAVGEKAHAKPLDLWKLKLVVLILLLEVFFYC